MLTIVNGVTSKQVLANEIINLLETMGLDGYFYLGYPVLGGIDGKIKVDALLVSEQTGIVLFDLETLAEENMEDKIQLLDELYNNMEAKLKRYGYLSKRRVLQVPINVLSYAPLYKTKSDEICTSIEEVKEYFEEEGIDMDGAVTGVSIVTNSETSGIGSKVMSNEPLTNGTRVLDQFIGKSAADGVLSVGSNVDAITGATVSTKGVTTGVNAALAAAGVIG